MSHKPALRGASSVADLDFIIVQRETHWYWICYCFPIFSMLFTFQESISFPECIVFTRTLIRNEVECFLAILKISKTYFYEVLNPKFLHNYWFTITFWAKVLCQSNYLLTNIVVVSRVCITGIDCTTKCNRWTALEWQKSLCVYVEEWGGGLN